MVKKGKAIAKGAPSGKKEERLRRKELQKERRKQRHKHNDQEEQEFITQLEELACRVKTVEADGNCLFRSLADQLGGDEREHRRRRSEIVEYIRSNRDWFEVTARSRAGPLRLRHTARARA